MVFYRQQRHTGKSSLSKKYREVILEAMRPPLLQENHRRIAGMFTSSWSTYNMCHTLIPLRVLTSCGLSYAKNRKLVSTLQVVGSSE
jgi:hypothetical protein